MTTNLQKFDGLPIISRPKQKILVDAKTMQDLISASVDTAFDLIGVYIEPEAAEKLLTINSQNRPLTPGNVERLVDQIQTKNWGISNDMIVVSSGQKPYLLNGQNRCNACIMAGEPILVDLRFGADPKSFLTMDKGKKRTPGDDLFVHASQRDHEMLRKNSTLISQVVRFMIGYFENDCDFRVSKSSQEIINRAYERYYPLIGFIDDARGMASTWGGSIYQYTAIRYMMEASNPSAAKEFWNTIRSQEGMLKDTPEMRINRRFTLIQGLGGKYERGACLIIAFNQKIGADPVGRNALIEYPRYTAQTYPRLMKPDGSFVTIDDFPKMIKPKSQAA